MVEARGVFTLFPVQEKSGLSLVRRCDGARPDPQHVICLLVLFFSLLFNTF